ncbi:MAG TPA: hypothetical protein DIW30_00180 [Bacteroidales bacterium]|nr:hypothetical protein [Bacteroidales bacterium]
MTMKKSIPFIVAIFALLVSCKENSLKQQYKSLNDKIESEINKATSLEEKDSLIAEFKQQAYTLLCQNIEKEYSDSVFLDIFYMLSSEEQNTLFSLMPEKMKEEKEIAACYKSFVAQQETSVGRVYKEIQGLDLQSEPFALSSLVGKTDYVLVDFWASWCGPCRRLLPKLKALYEELPEGRLSVLGISCDRDLNAWKQTIEKEQLPWQQIRDTGSVPYNPFDTYGVVSIPTTVLIDSTGTIIARNPSEAELKVLLQ